MKTKKSIPIVLAGFVAVLIAGTSLYMTTAGAFSQTQSDEIVVHVFSSFKSEDVEVLKDLSKSVIKGEVVKKYQIIEPRDEFGVLVSSDSSKAVVKEPYLVYEIQTKNIIRGNDLGDLVKVKVMDGSVDGLTVEAGYDEYQVGDIVTVLVDGPFDNEIYQPTAGPHSIFKIENGWAVGAEKTMPEASLLEKLR